MTKLVWMNGNLGFYGYDQFDDYQTTALSAAGMTLTYDTSHGSLDPSVLAASLHFTITGYTSYIVETGPDAGQERVTAGTITGLQYMTGSGAVMLDITLLSVGLPIFLATLARGDAAAAWGMITHAGNSVTGSNSAAGPGHLGTGDVIDTGSGTDTVNAFGGDDYIKDHGGTDSYNGGVGFDTVSYDGWFFQPQNVLRGLAVDLALGTVIGPDGNTDKVVSIEAVTGTFKADVMYGDGFANKFSGMAGADRFDGRSGFDFVSYASDAGQGGTDGIKVNLGLGTVRDGFGNLDHLVSIEGVEGTAVADNFTDNASDNYFDGGAGDDVFHFTGGKDTGHGGLGADTFSFRGTVFDDDTIDDFSQAQGDTIIFENATSFAQIHLFSVTVAGALAVNVQFGSGSVTVLHTTLAQLHAADFGF